MAEQVTLSDVPVASAGLPAQQTGFSRPLNAVSSAIVSSFNKKADKSPLSDLLVQFGKVSTALQQGAITAKDAKVQRTAITTTFVTNFPDLTSEAQNISSKAFSESGIVGQHLIASNIEEKETVKFNVNQTNQTISTYIPRFKDAPFEEKKREASFVEQKLADLASGKLDLEELKLRTDLNEANAASIELDLYDKMATGFSLETLAAIREIVGEFNPATATGEEVVAMKLALNNRLATTKANLRLELKHMEANGKLSGPLAGLDDMFKDAIDYVDNKASREAFDNANELKVSMARANLYEDRIVPQLAAILGEFKLFPDLLASGVGKSKAQNEFVTPFMNVLFEYMKRKDAGPNSGDIPVDEIIRGKNDSPQEVQNKERKVSTSMKEYQEQIQDTVIKDPGAADVFTPVLRRYTQKLKTETENVHPQVMEDLLDVVSNSLDYSKALIQADEGTALQENLTPAFRTYFDTITEALGRDLKSNLQTIIEIPVPKEDLTIEQEEILIPGTDVDINLFFKNKLGITFSTRLPVPPKATALTRDPGKFVPKVHQAIKVTPHADGLITFEPKEAFIAEPSVVAKANELNKKFSNRFRKIVRSVAHMSNGDSDYSKAFGQLANSVPGFFEVAKEVQQETQFTPEAVTDQFKGELKELMDTGDKEAVIEKLRSINFGADEAKEFFDLNIPELGKVEEEAIIQLDDGTLAIVRNGKLVKPTAQDLQVIG